jgi:1-aminocyclopropane-1-carboxylate deaminase
MSSIFTSPPIQEIHHDERTANVQIHVLRLDLIHPFVNGNKWFKLKYNLEAARQENLKTILTFGGAFSNHIYATAAAGKFLGFQTIGIIRGEEIPLNPTLDFATKQGMQLVYVNRKTYRERNTEALQQELKARFGNVFLIPEGGCNFHGVRGCTEIINTIISGFDTICLACGTATTLTGIALSLNAKQRVIGFPVLKGGDFLNRDIESLLAEYLSSGLPVPGDKSLLWELVCNYHFGGYAKINEELIGFKKEFEVMHGIPLDYIYTAKMFYGVMDLIKLGYFDGCRLLLVHTGGLQGNLGMEARF